MLPPTARISFTTVAGVGDEDVPAPVHRHAMGPLKPLPSVLTVVYAARRQNLLHRIVAVIGDEDVPAPVHRHAIGHVEAAAHDGEGASELHGLRRKRHARQQQHGQHRKACQAQRVSHDNSPETMLGNG